MKTVSDYGIIEKGTRFNWKEGFFRDEVEPGDEKPGFKTGGKTDWKKGYKKDFKGKKSK